MHASEIDGPRGYPVIGEMLSIALKRQYYFLEKYKKHRSYFTTKTFNKNAIVLFGEDTCKEILANKSGHFSSYLGWSLLEPLLGRGILLEDGDLHLRYRSLIHASFSKISREDIYSLIFRVTSRHLDRWQQQRTIPLYRSLKKLAFDIIFSLVFGEVESVFMKEELECSLYTLLNGQLSLLRIDNELFKYGKAMSARRTLFRYIEKEIDNYRNGRNDNSVLSNILYINKRTDYNISNTEIITLALQVLFAGYETTAKLGTYLLLLLYDNPRYYENIRLAGDKISENSNCLNKLDSIRFLDYLLYESERLYPPIYVIPRGLTRDFVLDDLLIPQDWLIYLSVSITHRLESEYNMPNCFLPERFTAGNKKKALIGFGHGIHSCLGKEIAKIEIKTLITLLFERFYISIHPRVKNYKSAINFSSFVKSALLNLELK